MNTEAMNVKTCRYIEATEIFKGFGLAWDVFINSDPTCTWGDNNRSMVTADFIINTLEESDLNVGPEANHVEQVIKILDTLEPDVYVDLEN